MDKLVQETEMNKLVQEIVDEETEMDKLAHQNIQHYVLTAGKFIVNSSSSTNAYFSIC